MTAEQLDAPIRWFTANGDQMVGAAGDWLVRDTVTQWVVAHHVFAGRYASAGNGTYVRKGSVRAARLGEVVRLTTLEGPATGRPGDWVAVGDDDDVWVISNDHFDRAYVRA